MRQRRSGFTMIELLVVIGIILFLMAFITYVFVRYNVGVQKKATNMLIQRIGIGLEQYAAQVRAYCVMADQSTGEEASPYPPDTGFGLPITSNKKYDSGSLYRYLGKELTLPDGRKVGPFVKFEPGELVKYTDPTYGDSYYIVDAWRMPIGYIGNPKRVIHSRTGCDLFSAGPDKKTVGTGCTDNNAYDGNDNDSDGEVDNATELGTAIGNGTQTLTKRNKVADDVLDDINNWDPQF